MPPVLSGAAARYGGGAELNKKPQRALFMELYVFSHLINIEVRELWSHLSSLRQVVWEVSLELIQPGENES